MMVFFSKQDRSVHFLQVITLVSEPNIKWVVRGKSHFQGEGKKIQYYFSKPLLKNIILSKRYTLNSPFSEYVQWTTQAYYIFKAPIDVLFKLTNPVVDRWSQVESNAALTKKNFAGRRKTMAGANIRRSSKPSLVRSLPSLPRPSLSTPLPGAYRQQQYLCLDDVRANIRWSRCGNWLSTPPSCWPW